MPTHRPNGARPIMCNGRWLSRGEGAPHRSSGTIRSSFSQPSPPGLKLLRRLPTRAVNHPIGPSALGEAVEEEALVEMVEIQMDQVIQLLQTVELDTLLIYLEQIHTTQSADQEEPMEQQAQEVQVLNFLLQTG